ncbi:hypothetical protein JOM56_001683 [Amanita muscaria]
MAQSKPCAGCPLLSPVLPDSPLPIQNYDPLPFCLFGTPPNFPQHHDLVALLSSLKWFSTAQYTTHPGSTTDAWYTQYCPLHQVQVDEEPRGAVICKSAWKSTVLSVLDSSSAQATYGSDVGRDTDNKMTRSKMEMLYSPLMPTATSLVSIADSEMVPIVAVREEEENDNGGGREERTSI